MKPSPQEVIDMINLFMKGDIPPKSDEKGEYFLLEYTDDGDLIQQKIYKSWLYLKKAT